MNGLNRRECGDNCNCAFVQTIRARSALRYVSYETNWRRLIKVNSLNEVVATLDNKTIVATNAHFDEVQISGLLDE